MKVVINLLQIACVLYEIVLATDDFPLVKIDEGLLKGGYHHAWKGKSYSAFTAIPYAKPPIGDLRFEPAVPAEPWNEILDATKAHPMCTQVSVIFRDFMVNGDEDCLYLNVYTPLKHQYENHKLPVMVFIHGGAWTTGDGKRESYGPDYLLEEDVLLVVINYRLGAFGFLSTEDSIVPGNMGLKDQVLALRWVNRNIGHFGGDPNKVTIFGHSAGAASVMFHLLSPLSKGLFSGAIAQSGSALAPWAVAKQGEMLNNARTLAKLVNCPTSSTKELIRCLKNVDAYDIPNQDEQFYVFSFDPLSPYMPVVEGEFIGSFLTSDPMSLIKAGKVAKVPLMAGLTSEEGCVKSAALYSNLTTIEFLNKHFNMLLPLILKKDTSTEISEAVRNFYFGDKEIDGNTKVQLEQLFTDTYFSINMDEIIRHLTEYSNQEIYYYLFGFRGRMTFASFFSNQTDDYGVCHFDEFYYLLNSDYYAKSEPNESEKMVRNFMVKLWTNFAKYGNPTPKKTEFLPVVWSPATNKKGDFYNIKSHIDVKMDSNLYADRVEFWKNIWHKDKSFVKNEL